MNIAGSIPQHIARAYGIKSSAPKIAPVAAPAMPTPTDTIGKNLAPRDEFVLSTKITGASAPTTRATEMIAGRVASPVEFTPIETITRSTAFSLYTRAADRVEAAVGVEIGRRLDVSG